MIRSNEWKRFIETLTEMPNVSVVCKRTKISKATLYRKVNSDPEFKEKFNEAIEQGRDTMGDLAESQLFKAISKGERWAIMSYLEAHDRRYRKPRKAIGEPPRTLHTVQIEVLEAGPKVDLRARPKKKLLVLGKA